MNILLVCGGGASSSFVAQNVQKACNTNGIDAEVSAIGETELEDYIEGNDIAMFGPHLKYLEESLAETCDYYEVPYKFVQETHYAKMDGQAILNDILEELA